MEPKGDIALIGLAVMGQNLILNMNDHGFTVVAYNRTVSKVDDFMNGAAKDTNIIGAQSIEEMVGHLKRPRRVMMLVKAGQPVDDFIDHVIPYLEQGDIIIDGGNSLYQDSIRRTEYLRARGLLFRRHRRFRWRGRRAPRPLDHAGWPPRRLAAREGDFPSHLGQGR